MYFLTIFSLKGLWGYLKKPTLSSLCIACLEIGRSRLALNPGAGTQMYNNNKSWLIQQKGRSTYKRMWEETPDFHVFSGAIVVDLARVWVVGVVLCRIRRAPSSKQHFREIIINLLKEFQGTSQMKKVGFARKASCQPRGKISSTSGLAQRK